MCMRLHAVGFPCEMDRRTAEFIATVAAAPRRTVRTPDGDYRIWRATSGAELWLHYAAAARRTRPGDGAATARRFDPIGDLTGMSVTHAGASRIPIRLSRVLTTTTSNPLEGVAIGMLPSRRGKDRPVPFTFDLVDFARRRRAAPSVVTIQATALASRIWAFAGEHEYLAATPRHRLVACGSIALVSPDEVPDAALVYKPRPGTLWLLTGTVTSSTRLINPVTSAPYYAIALDTDRGAFDLIARPEVIEGDVSTGHVLQAVATVSGRILDGRD